MTNEEIKKQFQILKDNMHENYAIYHERSTFLIQLIKFEVGDLGVRFRAKLIKPLDKSQSVKTILYSHYLSNSEITFSSTYLFSNEENSSILKGNKLMRAYCPYILWLDPELVKFVIANGDEIIQKVVDYILFDEDWTELKSKI